MRARVLRGVMLVQPELVADDQMLVQYLASALASWIQRGRDGKCRGLPGVAVRIDFQMRQATELELAVDRDVHSELVPTPRMPR